MKYLNDISVAKRLWAFTVTALMALIVGSGVSQHQSQAALRAALEKVEQHNEQIVLSLRWKALAAAGIELAMAKALSSEPLLNDTLTPRLDGFSSEVNELQSRIKEVANSPVERQALDKVVQVRHQVLDVIRQVGEARTSGERGAMVELIDQRLKPGAELYLNALAAFVGVKEMLRNDVKTDALKHAERVEILGWTAMVIVLGVSVAGMAWMVRSITKPLKDAVQAAETIASGDLTRVHHVERHDELGQLMNAIAGMSQQLRCIVLEVRQGVESVRTASAEIASGNHDLSQRTEQAAGSLQSTASSMEQMTSAVCHSAETARQATRLASVAADSAGQGQAMVEQVVASMVRISERSQRMSEIIGAIDGIAFQTNILALNAAVEAARAAEYGRGFAVVASEVRSLAQRSAEAAKEIKVLITSSVETVDAGCALVQQTGMAMREMVASARDVSKLMDGMSASADEQRDGIGQINAAVGYLDSATQQNAALVEQSAAAAQSLQRQAQRLAEAVSLFKVELTAGTARF